MSILTNFSVLIAVYHKEKSLFLEECLKSLFQQTLKPDEIVLIKDGVLTDELENTIQEWSSLLPLKVFGYEQNKGLAYALQYGLEKCSHNIVARMDSDDICDTKRFEKQIPIMISQKLDVLGSNISEFTKSPEFIISERIVPSLHKEICGYLKKRCPFNHMSVILNKNAVLQAGGYKELLFNEDYYLWIRMFEKKFIFANIPESLVYVRISLDTFGRRGGIKYFCSELKIQLWMYNHSIISFCELFLNISIRFIIQCLLTSRMRKYIFLHFFRNNKKRIK